MARVVLSRAEWGRPEPLPPCCVYCGQHADGYVVKRLQHTTGGTWVPHAVSGEVALVALLLAALKWLVAGKEPVRTTQVRVHLPVCARHRRAWLVWSWFRAALDHEAVVLSGVAEGFARAVEQWRSRAGGAPASAGEQHAEPGASEIWTGGAPSGAS